MVAVSTIEVRYMASPSLSREAISLARRVCSIINQPLAYSNTIQMDKQGKISLSKNSAVMQCSENLASKVHVVRDILHTEPATFVYCSRADMLADDLQKPQDCVIFNFLDAMIRFFYCSEDYYRGVLHHMAVSTSSFASLPLALGCYRFALIWISWSIGAPLTLV